VFRRPAPPVPLDTHGRVNENTIEAKQHRVAVPLHHRPRVNVTARAPSPTAIRASREASRGQQWAGARRAFAEGTRTPTRRLATMSYSFSRDRSKRPRPPSPASERRRISAASTHTQGARRPERSPRVRVVCEPLALLFAWLISDTSEGRILQRYQVPPRVGSRPHVAHRQPGRSLCQVLPGWALLSFPASTWTDLGNPGSPRVTNICHKPDLSEEERDVRQVVP